MLATLDFIIIDELHAFLQGPRGLHLASLLRRIDGFSAKRARRIGLSATLGDLSMAARWLNPAAPETVTVVESASEGPELRLQVRAYGDPEDVEDPDGLENPTRPPTALDQMADHLFRT